MNLQGADEEEEDKILRTWIEKDYIVFARINPSHSKQIRGGLFSNSFLFVEFMKIAVF